MSLETDAPFAAAERTRMVALLGSALSGKTTLFNRLMSAAEAPLHRPGMAVGHCRFGGKPWMIVDCLEFLPLPSIDVAVVVCEPTRAGARAVAPLLADLQAVGVAHLLFTNKIDTIFGRLRDTVATLQEQSARPLVLREVPVHERGSVLGHVDLVSARAFGYRPDEPPALFAVPSRPRGAETNPPDGSADRDAGLYARMLNDVRLSPDEIFKQQKRKRRAGDVVEVMLGSALHGNGVDRLWRSLRDTARLADRRAKPREGSVSRRLSA
jgi:elongation factor G